MSDRCQSAACAGGNCPGCRNGALFCEDPRCYPDCQGCDTKPPGQNNGWLVTIILIGLGLLLVLALVVGFGWFNDRKKAAEPKQLTVNKHIHTVTPPSIVVTSPTPRLTSVPSNVAANAASNVAANVAANNGVTYTSNPVMMTGVSSPYATGSNPVMNPVMNPMLNSTFNV